MTEHPAHQMARMAADYAAELRGYMDPADSFPWELTDADHRAILPRLYQAIAQLAVCIEGIAQATGDKQVKRLLDEGVGRVLSGCTHVSAAGAMLATPDDEPSVKPVIAAQPPRLSAADFPAAMTADLLQAAAAPQAQQPGTAATTSPARTHAPSRQPGGPRAR